MNTVTCAECGEQKSHYAAMSANGDTMCHSCLDARCYEDAVAATLGMATGSVLCPTCHGTGHSGSLQCPECPRCGGSGKVDFSSIPNDLEPARWRRAPSRPDYPAVAHQKAVIRARREPLCGPLTAQETLDDARALLAAVDAEMATLAAQWATWRNYRRWDRARKCSLVVGIPLGVALVIYLVAVLAGPVVDYLGIYSCLGIAALTTGCGGIIASMTTAVRAKSTAGGANGGEPVKPQRTLDEVRNDREACQDYLWVIEGSVPPELVVPGVPDWTAIASAVEYDPEDDEYPRYSFELPTLEDVAPAYESTVAEVRERMTH